VIPSWFFILQLSQDAQSNNHQINQLSVASFISRIYNVVEKCDL